MSIFQRLHHQKKTEEKEVKKVGPKATVKKTSPKKANQKPVAKKSVEEKKVNRKEEVLNTSVAGKIKKTERPALTFHFPHVSEKATRLEEEEGKYVFRVNRRTNKVEIKKAFEEMHRVKVASVRIINIPRKKRDWRGKTGYRPGYKKAIIKLAKGQKVNIH